MAGSEQDAVLSWDNAVYLADFLLASGERRVSLLGGEPSLHPDFVALTAYFAARGFNVTVFTSGILSSAKLAELKTQSAQLPPDRVQFVCNINNPEQTPEGAKERERLEAFLTAMGRWTMPAFNIYRRDYDIGFLFDLVERFGMRRRLRLGIAHPIPGAGNAAIAVDDIEGVIARLSQWRERFEATRVKPNFDCGFALCKIGDEQLGWLTRLSGRIEFKCNPAVDITPELEVYCCFPLAGLARKSVFDFDSYRQLVDYYRDLQRRLRAEIAGIFPECADCVHRAEGTCTAGGACQIASRLTRENPARLVELERALGATDLPA
jgi:cyclic pyranopterin phosphate synthase